MTEQHPRNQTTRTGRTTRSEFAFQPGQFDRVRDVLARYSGIYLDQTNQRTITTALSQRLQSTGTTFDEYVTLLKQSKGRDELQTFAELLLNHETVFFRNQPHMRALRNVLFPQLHQRKPVGAPIRIWSAGCSTGEEPYSLAMLARETLGAVLPRPVNIWATDLSEGALDKARAGRYRGRTLSNVSPDIQKRYFEYQYRGDAWAVSEQIRAMVTFEQFNLLDPFPPQINGVDMIFCQNVTIYFSLETFRALVDRFYHILPEGGLLFLGFSETLWNIYDKFRLQEVEGAFVYVKDPPTPVPAPAPPALPSIQPTVRPGRAGQPDSPVRSGRTTRQSPSATPPATGVRGSTGQTTRGGVAPNAPATSPEQAILQKGQELLDLGRADEVLDMLYQVPLNGPHAPRTLALIARAHANRGDLDVAVAEARRALELHSLTTEAYILLGVLYGQQGELSTAAKHLERARYLDSDAPLISFYLAEVYRQENRSDMALREYRNTLRKLTPYAPDTLLDGVAVRWLRDTCERYVQLLSGRRM